MTTRRMTAAAWFFAVHLALAADEPAPEIVKGRPDDVVGAPVKLVIEPDQLVLSGARSARQLLATGHYADGTVRDLTRSVRFESSDEKLAHVGEDGVVVPKGDGKVRITARIPSPPLEASCNVDVRDAAKASPVNFRLEAVPAFTRSRCNSGACHGTPSGKGGFRLSLQGYLPDQDYLALTREAFGRRTNPLDPPSSLILKKGQAEIAHEGGKKLWKNEIAYQVVEQWIAEGCKAPPAETPELDRLEILPRERVLRDDARNQQVVVVAHYKDGSARDVTPLVFFSTSDEQVATVSKNGIASFKSRGSVAVLCRYLHLVDNAKLSYIRTVPGFVWNNPPEWNYVDKHVFAKLRELQILPSELCTDEEFVRRVHLDAAGVLPEPDAVTAFLADKDPDKRKKLIDRVLDRPEYADYWALKWADVLRNTRKQVAYKGAHNYRRFLYETFLHNRPFDAFVRALLTSSGDTMMNPEANYYRVARDPQDCAETTAQLFLGVRMQCAKCHNHPFERWTQDDYYGFAAFFARVRQKKPDAQGEQEVVYLARDGEVQHLRTQRVMPPKAPGQAPYTVDPSQDRRRFLADWLTQPDNPFLARSVVNRIWYHLMGKGIVDPVDDFRDSNPPSNGELLDALAGDFVKSGFDFRHVVRTILNSRTYQASARAHELNADDEKYFSRAYTKLLPAEPLLDAISTATGTIEKFPGLPPGTRAIQLPDGEINHQFLQAFGQPTRELACECARESDSTLNQALNLINGDVIHNKLRDPNNRIGKLMAANKSDAEIIGELYLATLSRPARPEEIQAASAHIEKTKDRRRALEDIHWALLNCKEFLFRH